MQGHGLNTFTVEEAHRMLGGSLSRVRLGLSRLTAHGRLIRPAKGLYVIVAPEHQAIGAPPPTWYIDELMRHTGLPYYVGLLSAAALHGASHQAPQELQVVTSEVRPVKVIGRGRIRWVKKPSMENSAIQIMSTPIGSLRVSTPETTALDLVRYAKHAGSLNNVATVLADLSESLDVRRLAPMARMTLPTARRLGYLLGIVGKGALAEDFRERLNLPPVRLLPLDKLAPTEDAPVDDVWRLIINATIDPD